MIRRFNDEKPIEDKAYDVFGNNGDYIGYCDFYSDAWHLQQGNKVKTIIPYGTYYSDDHDDWLRMIEGLIEVQKLN